MEPDSTPIEDRKWLYGIDYSTLEPGAVIHGGGIAIFLREIDGRRAVCLNVMTGELGEWGCHGQVLDFSDRDEVRRVFRSYALDGWEKYFPFDEVTVTIKGDVGTISESLYQTFGPDRYSIESMKLEK